VILDGYSFEIPYQIISRKTLTKLNISGLVNLKRLDYVYNFANLFSFDLSSNVNLTVLGCSENQLTSIDFLNSLPNPDKLEILEIYDNNIQPTTLDFLKSFANLKSCKLGENVMKESKELQNRLQSKTYNKFYGSLEPIKNLTKLENFCIAGTDINEGLEYISTKIAQSSSEAVKKGYNPITMNLIDCQPLRNDAKVVQIQGQLRPFNYDNIVNNP
jgi:hypothetical protein